MMLASLSVITARDFDGSGWSDGSCEFLAAPAGPEGKPLMPQSVSLLLESTGAAQSGKVFSYCERDRL
jgi:hypothetical protein